MINILFAKVIAIIIHHQLNHIRQYILKHLSQHVLLCFFYVVLQKL